MYRGEWKLPFHVEHCYVHVAGNDFKKPGPCVKGALPWDFEEIVTMKLSEVHSSSDKLTLVLWGDWNTWQKGFKNSEGGERYNEFCSELIRIAKKVCDNVLWVRGEQLDSVPTWDNWHFSLSAKSCLQSILRALNIDCAEKSKSENTTNMPETEKKEGDIKKQVKTNKCCNQMHEDFLAFADLSNEHCVLCIGCMEWRKPNGFLHHLEHCLPNNLKERGKAISFAYGQVRHFEKSIEIFKKHYKMPDYVVAEAPKALRPRLIAGMYGNRSE